MNRVLRTGYVRVISKDDAANEPYPPLWERVWSAVALAVLSLVWKCFPGERDE